MNESDLDCELTTTSSLDPKRVNKAIAYACRILGMREYSRKSMHKKLALKGYDLLESTKAVDYLLENNWLSDQRFCEVFIRSKISRGQGLTRIQYELIQNGISQDLIDIALLEQGQNWQNTCNEVAARKVESANLKDNLKDRQKLERFLRYRGFSGEQVRYSITKHIK